MLPSETFCSIFLGLRTFLNYLKAKKSYPVRIALNADIKYYYLPK